VIDVGVANGTPELYRAFPKANLILVDPLLDVSRERLTMHLLSPRYSMENAHTGILAL
jgi:hypothetical protein